MKFYNFNLNDLRTWNYAKSIGRILAMALSAAFLLSCPASTVQAAIVWSDEVTPLDPGTWTFSTDGYIGQSSTGTIVVNGGSILKSGRTYLAFNSASTGMVLITGTGSNWTGNSLYDGYSGSGMLDIESGGQVSTLNGSYLGYNAGSDGTAIVSGTGSKWTVSGSLNVGYYGKGTLNIKSGGQLITNGTSANYLGYGPGSFGDVMITGAGSQWVSNNDIYVGYGGSGTLTVSDGGTVTIKQVLYTSLNSLAGNGTISTNGAVLDADIFFDAAHGSQPSFAFGSGGKLNLNQSSSYALGAGYRGNGTLRIADGMTVASATGYLGVLAGSTGTATVTGTGSKWTNGTIIYVGNSGNGTLNIQDGGQVSCTVGYLGYNPGSIGNVLVTGTGSQWATSVDLEIGHYGNGTLTVDAGGTVNSYLGSIGNQAGSLGMVTVTGAGSVWTNGNALNIGEYGNGTLVVKAGGIVNSLYGYIGSYAGSNGTVVVSGMNSTWTNNSSFVIGLKGSGTLTVEDGGQVINKGCSLGAYSGSIGTVKVSGSGSKWISQGDVSVGYSGSGTLNIEGGGQVNNTTAYLGYVAGSSGTATVTGAGSQWINSGWLFVGAAGSGKLTVSNGATVTVNQGLFASFNDLFGDGVISTNGAVLDADLVIDNSHGLQKTLAFGSGGTLNVTLGSGGVIGVGYKDNGTLRITDGKSVASSGSGTVDGAYLGYLPGSTGVATVTGAGSQWAHNGALDIGYSGCGSLKIEAGGQVNNKNGFIARNLGSSGATTVSGTGSTWTNSGSLEVGVAGSGTLNIEAGGQVSNTNGYLGYRTDATGTVTITGSGSQWTNSGYLYVGYAGNGTLTVTDGGAVTASKGIFASLSSLSGNGTISTNGAVLDLDLVFDSSHGLQKTFVFGNGGTLNLNQDRSGVLGAGYKGSGTLRIADGISVASNYGYLGYQLGARGTATVTGAGSTWTNSSELYVGYFGSGALNVEAGAMVSNTFGFIGDSINSSPTASGSVTVTGIGSLWQNNGGLLIGNGVLNIAAAGRVTNSICYLGSFVGSNGTVTVSGVDSQWTNDVLDVGKSGNGRLNIDGGGQVSSSAGYVGYETQSTGLVTVSGMGSAWNNAGELYIGYGGPGTLNIEGGARVSNTNGYVGYTVLQSSARIAGSGSQWIQSGEFCVATGTVNIEDGGQVVNTIGYLGYNSNTTSTAKVTGKGSNWSNSGKFYVAYGYSGSGTLSIESGGQVSNADSYLGYGSYSTSAVTVIGAGSKWTTNGTLYVGYLGSSSLDIENGGQVTSTNAYLGYGSGSLATVTVTGINSQWNNSSKLYIGNATNCTLNIGTGIASGGLVSASNLSLGNSGSASGTCNLNGGTLLVGTIARNNGQASFNWYDGTIQNYNASTNLSIATPSLSMVLKLSSTGTHAFNIDSGRTGTINAVLSDATSGGTLLKQGLGLLTLTAANTYTGSTTISTGTLALSSTGSLASSLIDVQSGATFDVSAKSGGFSLGTNQTLEGAGTIVGNLIINGIHAPGSSPGIETVKGNYSMLGQLNIELAGTIAGTGYDQVLLPVNGTTKYNTTLSGMLSLDWNGMNSSTDTTKLWILKNDTAGTLSGTFANYSNGASLGNHDGHDWLLWYGADAATGNLTGGNDVVIAAVPEPSSLALLGACILGILAWVKGRNYRISCRPAIVRYIVTIILPISNCVPTATPGEIKQLLLP